MSGRKYTQEIHRVRYFSNAPQPTAEQLEAQRIRENAPRSLTSLFCGDPAPGFSALDRKRTSESLNRFTGHEVSQ